MKLGLVGGSFDPIHAGHVEPVRSACRAVGLDRVLFLPTASPPHKPERRFAPAFARYAMVEMALLDEADLHVSAHELTPGRAAYTIETLEHFATLWPRAELHLLIGADSFVELPTWRRWRELAELARLLVMQRPGHSARQLPATAPAELVELAESDRVSFLDNPPIAASSTAIRELLARGETPPEGWLHPAVLDYCRKYDLYR